MKPAAPSLQTPPRRLTTEALADRAGIFAVVDGIASAVDDKDWARARAHLTDEIDADFTSLVGGSPARMPADALVAGWRRNLHADKASHHMRPNHQVAVDGGRAEVLSKGHAFDRLAGNLASDL